MIEELGDLNMRFYQLYGDLRENYELLTPKQIDFMSDVLYDQYKSEYERLRLQNEINEKNALYNIRYRHSALVPKKKFFVFKNRAMRQSNSELSKEINAIFAQREQAECDRQDGGEWVEEDVPGEDADAPDDEAEDREEDRTEEETDEALGGNG